MLLPVGRAGAGPQRLDAPVRREGRCTMRKAMVMFGPEKAGAHMRSYRALGREIQGRDCRVTFSRNGQSIAIDPEFPASHIMTAVANLGIYTGVAFRLACDGPEANAVFEALRQVLASEEFPEAKFSEESE